jgi:hypothetical protein
MAWIYLVLFVRIGTFQWVTANPNKKPAHVSGSVRNVSDLPSSPNHWQSAGLTRTNRKQHNTDFCYSQRGHAKKSRGSPGAALASPSDDGNAGHRAKLRASAAVNARSRRAVGRGRGGAADRAAVVPEFNTPAPPVVEPLLRPALPPLIADRTAVGQRPDRSGVGDPGAADRSAQGSALSNQLTSGI